MLSANAPPAPAGEPRALTASVPRLAWLAHPPSAPTVPVGFSITHRPASIIRPPSAPLHSGLPRPLLTSGSTSPWGEAPASVSSSAAFTPSAALVRGGALGAR